MNLGILFGAGAEISYGLPTGGKFALEIFRQDTSMNKELFKCKRDRIIGSTRYAANWLPDDYKTKSVSSYGKSVFETIIKDTIEHNRDKIINKLNDFDEIAKFEEKILKQYYHKPISKIIEDKLGTQLRNCNMKQEISFVEVFADGNKIFSSNYFSALLKMYKNKDNLNESVRTELRKIIIAIFQLQIGALSENLTRKINDGVFTKKDDSIDLLDDIGDFIQLNYQSTGLSGLEYVLENKNTILDNDDYAILCFSRNIIESIYSSVLDYKSLIDSNWHYLYCPKEEWAKFCKISIFLMTVREYISNQLISTNIDIENGYYHDLRKYIENNKITISSIATTNYNVFIKNVLNCDVTFLNGSIDMWYDPYLNRIGSRDEFEDKEEHFIVPLLFTQSGTKPMTSIEMSINYVNMYNNFKRSDVICIVGFGFNPDDEHINGILRTLVDINNKKIVIVGLNEGKSIEEKRNEISDKLKILNVNNIEILLVDKNRLVDGVNWMEKLKHL